MTKVTILKVRCLLVAATGHGELLSLYILGIRDKYHHKLACWETGQIFPTLVLKLISFLSHTITFSSCK